MVFVRSELKDQAKGFINRNYWGMVAAGLVMAFAIGSLQGNISTYSLTSGDASEKIRTLEVAVELVVTVGSIAVVLLIMHPLEFGGAKYFTRNIDGTAQGTLFDGFKKENFSHAISVYFYRNVMIFLYTLLLVIPGIIKMYEYYFVSFLAVDFPGKSGKELCEMSRQMTQGSKMELFKLDLSFILWDIANALTSGIVGVFYLYPYRFQTRALAYRLFLDNSGFAN